MSYRILAINPGSTSTKIAVYDDDQPIFEKTLRHSPEELAPYPDIIDQYDYRQKLVMEALKEGNIAPESLSAVVGRGGLMRPVPGGTFKINETMKKDLRNPALWGRTHASNLGAFIADSIAQEYQIPGFIVDPVVVDEMEDIARISGIPEIKRNSLFHALNIRYISRLLAEELNQTLEESNFIGVHMGGGMSIAAIKKGRVVDVNNALLGDGPFSPQRAGTLPIGDLVELAFSGKYTHTELIKYFSKNAGWMAYLGTDNGIEVYNRIQKGDAFAKLITDAMCYKVAKEIGGCAAVLEGKIDAIFFSGGLSFNEYIVEYIKSKIQFLAPIYLYPGEKEMEALAQGGLRVLRGIEKAQEYVQI